MGAVLSVVSQKGGVGKTTTAVNLAAAFARRGMKTLLIDVDPQGSVRYGSGLARGHETAGFADYLNGEKTLREIILPTADRKSTRLNSSHRMPSRMPSSA